jgi:hypothetical protein
MCVSDDALVLTSQSSSSSSSSSNLSHLLLLFLRPFTLLLSLLVVVHVTSRHASFTHVFPRFLSLALSFQMNATNLLACFPILPNLSVVFLDAMRRASEALELHAIASHCLLPPILRARRASFDTPRNNCKIVVPIHILP